MLGLCACGGGSRDSTDQPQGSGLASDCFNPQLFAVGSTYELDYQVSGQFVGTQAPYTGTRNRSMSVQASPGTGAADVSVGAVVYSTFDPPVPGQSIPAQSRDVQALDGLDIITKQHIVIEGPGLELPTVYNPPIRDQRFALAPGGAFVLSVTGGTSSTVGYVGQETITVPAGTFPACKFEERAGDGSVQATWVLKGYGVIAKSVGASESQQLMSTSSINGQRIRPLQG